MPVFGAHLLLNVSDMNAPTPLPLVRPLFTDDMRAVEDTLTELLDMVRHRRLTGLAIVGLTPDGKTLEWIAGRAGSDPVRAHYGVSRLADRLLWPDEA